MSSVVLVRWCSRPRPAGAARWRDGNSTARLHSEQAAHHPESRRRSGNLTPVDLQGGLRVDEVLNVVGEDAQLPAHSRGLSPEGKVGIDGLLVLQVRVPPLERDRSLVDSVGEQIEAGGRPEPPAHVQHQRQRLGEVIKHPSVAGDGVVGPLLRRCSQLGVGIGVELAIVVASASGKVPPAVVRLLEDVGPAGPGAGVGDQGLVAELLEGVVQAGNPNRAGPAPQRRMMEVELPV